jgi:hypothetical protein
MDLRAKQGWLALITSTSSGKIATVSELGIDISGNPREAPSKTLNGSFGILANIRLKRASSGELQSHYLKGSDTGCWIYRENLFLVSLAVKRVAYPNPVVPGQA